MDFHLTPNSLCHDLEIARKAAHACVMDQDLGDIINTPLEHSNRVSTIDGSQQYQNVGVCAAGFRVRCHIL